MADTGHDFEDTGWESETIQTPTSGDIQTLKVKTVPTFHATITPMKDH
jgi:hypothetical protein